MQVSKKALLRGWYGYQNIGDEAMLHVLIEKLSKEGYQCIVSSHDVSYTKRVHSTDAVLSGMRLSFLRALLTVDILVEGPGNKHGFFSIIGQGVPFVANLLGKKVRYMGCGMSPNVWKHTSLHDADQIVKFPLLKQWIIRLLFNYLVEYISVRNKGSEQLLEANGVKSERITLVKDFAYNLQYPDFRTMSKVLHDKCEIDMAELPTVGISVRRFTDDNLNRKFARDIACIINQSLSVWNGQFMFIGFAKFGDDNDADFSSDIIQLIEKDYRNKVFIFDEERPDLVKGAVSECDLIIGVRYHAQVFADSCNVPFIAVVYDPKSEAVAHKGILRFNMENIDPDQVIDKIVKI